MLPNRDRVELVVPELSGCAQHYRMVTDKVGNPLPRLIEDDFGRTGGLTNDEPVHVEKGYEAMRARLVAHFSWLVKTKSAMWVQSRPG